MFSDPHKTHKYTVWAERRVLERGGGTYNNYRALKGYMTEVTGILEMGPFQQRDLKTYIKFHYRTGTHCITINSKQQSVSLQKLTVRRLATKFQSMLFVQTTPGLCTDPDQSNQTLPSLFSIRSILILYYLLVCLPSCLIPS